MSETDHATATSAAVEASFPLAENLPARPDLDNGDNGFISAEDATDDASSVTGESVASSTTSVSDSIREYRQENGRTYHKYKDGNLQHNLIVRSFDDRLGTAPPNHHGARVGRVLDLGTGSGIWAIEFGDEHPEAEVLGVDLSPSQPEFVPPNVRFEVDDIEEPWTYSLPFDYIHSRTMTFSISNWQAYLKEAFDHLNPGGYLELVEVDSVPLSDDGTLKEDSALMKSVRLLEKAAVIFGRPFVDIQGIGDKMAEVGFEDVHVQRFKWPTNPWAKNQRYKDIGAWTYGNLAPNWEAFCMAPLTRGLGWSREEVILHAMEVRRDLGDRSIHAYYLLWSIWGRKPAAATGPPQA
ncbi:methyltransferase [Colletotrichum falcatum]|nr:methyltransferase [Colletotrichum falcatum]